MEPGFDSTVMVAPGLASLPLSQASLTVPVRAKVARPPFADSKRVAAKSPRELWNKGG